jgi:hypothetical protein
LVKITYVRGSVIIPLILLLIYLGTFAEKNAFPDLILMLFFGVLGWMMQRLDWPRPPFILGLVLGNLAETRLFLSVNSYGLAWLLRPAVLVILALTIVGALYPFLRKRRHGKGSGEERSPTLSETSSEKKGLRFTWGAAFSLALILIFVAALWQSRKFSFTAGLFPWVLGFPVLAFAGVQFVFDLTGRGGGKEATHGREADVEIRLPREVVNRRTAGVFGWIIGWFVVIWLLGFTLGAPLCTFLQLKVGERESWPLTLFLTAAAWAFIYGVFGLLLHVPFPVGQLFLWLKQLSSI